MEVMFEAYGIRVSSDHGNENYIFFCNHIPFLTFLKKRISFFQLPLLKVLIDRLLQEGIEELLQVLDTTTKTTDKKESHAETQTSNDITEYTVCKLIYCLCWLHIRLSDSFLNFTHQTTFSS